MTGRWRLVHVVSADLDGPVDLVALIKRACDETFAEWPSRFKYLPREVYGSHDVVLSTGASKVFVSVVMLLEGEELETVPRSLKGEATRHLHDKEKG